MITLGILVMQKWLSLFSVHSSCSINVYEREERGVIGPFLITVKHLMKDKIDSDGHGKMQEWVIGCIY